MLQNRFYADTDWDCAIRAQCLPLGVCYQSYWTLTANREASDSAAMREIAARLGVSGAQLLFRYALQLGVTPLTGTSSAEHMRDDLAVPHMAELSAVDMDAVTAALEQTYADARPSPPA